jgi:hypothetical protein
VTLLLFYFFPEYDNGSRAFVHSKRQGRTGSATRTGAEYAG